MEGKDTLKMQQKKKEAEINNGSTVILLRNIRSIYSQTNPNWVTDYSR